MGLDATDGDAMGLDTMGWDATARESRGRAVGSGINAAAIARLPAPGC